MVDLMEVLSLEDVKEWCMGCWVLGGSRDVVGAEGWIEEENNWREICCYRPRGRRRMIRLGIN